MATEKRLIYLEDAIARIVDTPSYVATMVFEGYYGFIKNPASILVDRQNEILDLLEAVPTVDAMEVDKFNIMLHHIIIDNEGVPEVRLQIGDRYFILHTDPVDVREVVHGRWKFLNDYQSRCSECHEVMWVDHNAEPNYCPNCGADMRERKGNG